jgi:hypothetical protein
MLSRMKKLFKKTMTLSMNFPIQRIIKKKLKNQNQKELVKKKKLDLSKKILNRI